MRRVSFVMTLLMAFSVAAFAQTPPAPPAPAPGVPPVPPAAPAPVPAPRVVVAPPVLDRVEVMVPDILREIDVDAIRAQVEVDAQVFKEQAEEFKKQAEEFKAQAKEEAKRAAEETLKMRDFAFQLQGSGSAFARIEMGGGNYSSGLSYMARRQYDQAIARFDRVIAEKGAHADGALYWKAYAQYKLGKTDDALATIAELRRAHAQSRYLDDARVLEADARKTAGRPLTGDADDEEIKLLAISSMQSSNPEGAVALLENVLKATNSLQVKKRALFVLANNDQPAAHQLLLSYAKGRGNPDLQVEAIRYLTARRAGTTSAELEEIYSATQDVDVRRAVLNALVATGDRAAVLRIAGTGGAPVELRRSAISNLSRGSLASATELMQLYQKEENKDLKETMVRAFGSMGAADQLIQIVRTEKDPAVREQAIRSLGSVKSERSTQALADLYNAEQDKAVRKAVISALASQNNAEALITVARKETAGDLKIEIIRRLANMASRSKPAMDYLLEQIK